MSLYVISDLHIRGSEDPVYHSLLTLLRDRATRDDTVVMAGDIFDLFVGGKKVFLERYQEFFRQAQLALQRGVKLHYIEGNHDFLLNRAFRVTPGLRLHADDFFIELESKRFFFIHGDTVNKRDYAYRFLRFFMRSPLMRFLIGAVPGSWVDWVGSQSSRYSRETRPEAAGAAPLLVGEGGLEKLRIIYRSYAAEKLAQGYDFVVMGHCHDLDEMSFRIGERTGQYINVGYPRVHGSFLSWSPGDSKIQREKLPD